MSYNNILVAKENSIATITINRPTKLNALNTVTIKELHQAFEERKTMKHSNYFNRKR
jgi:enoyl-CoA hydratase